MSSVDEQGDPDLTRELEERFNALVHEQARLQTDDAAEGTTASERPEPASALAQ
jgi:hypothetical protein